ncbi:hypothetical protein, partial [Paralimibaculum aggregatum]|uniref:hypothetical protein n=1 Tax=Paralimibaculum aggregatum TaxID=3036245 RepID=UPI002552E006
MASARSRESASSPADNSRMHDFGYRPGKRAGFQRPREFGQLLHPVVLLERKQQTTYSSVNLKI